MGTKRIMPGQGAYKLSSYHSVRAAKKRRYTSPEAAVRATRNARAYAARMRSLNMRTGGFLGMTQKFYDTAVVSTAIGAPPDASGGEVDPATVLTISAPARGDTEQDRDGDRMIIKSAYVNGVIRVPAQTDQTAADVAGIVYVALVLDTQTNGAQLNSEDVFTNPSGNATTAASLLRNLQYTSRFKVLSSVKLALEQPNMVYDGTNIEQGGVVRHFTLSYNGDIPVQFLSTASGAGVAGVVNNSLHVIAFSDTSAVTTAPTIAYNARIRFQG